jgi:UDP-N-acetylmuramoyl-tripeptide--D-alanyl-D-alanine ligase
MRLSKGIDLYTYGTDSKCNISGKLIQEGPTIISEFLHEGISTKLNSKLSGKYNFYNILAAVAIGEYFKVKTTDIIQAIESYESDNNRSQLVKTKNNTIFLDAYNANPSSMEAAIENFNSINSENKIVILGVMNELGEASDSEHQNLVNNVTNKKFSRVFLVGKNFEKINTQDAIIKFESLESISEYLQKNEIKDADILIKGSRSNQLEKLVQYL